MSDSISPSNPIPLIQDMTRQELREWMVSQDLPAYRADQVYTWLYQRRVAGFGEMANLCKPAKFARGAQIRYCCWVSAEGYQSKNGFIKYRVVLD